MSKLLPELAAEGDKIVVTPARRTWSLRELIGDITPANRHREIQWGDRTGKESWQTPPAKSRSKVRDRGDAVLADIRSVAPLFARLS